LKRLNRFLPSPSMIIALIALSVALSGSAYALTVGSGSIKNNSVRGLDVKNYSLTGKDIKKNGIGGITVKESRLGAVPEAEGASHWAVLSAAGAKVRGEGVVNSLRTAEGRYLVTFDKDIRNCALTATIGSEGFINPPPNGQVTVSVLATDSRGAILRTSQSDGTAANRPSHLIVSC